MPNRGFTMIEIVVAVLILALAILPIFQFLGQSSVATRQQHSETEALQFACDMMDDIIQKQDFDAVVDIAETTPANPLFKTEIKYTLDVVGVPLTAMEPIYFPRVIPHPMCGADTVADTSDDGIEQTPKATMDTQIVEVNHLTMEQLDTEKLESISSPKFELKDIRLTVKWKLEGAPASDYERHPIVLISRKARL